MKHNGKSNIRATAIGIALVGCTVAGMTLVTPRPVYAQATDANAEKPISINLQNADVKSALKALFGMIGANYSIDSDVQGSVNITMNNIAFLPALRSLLHATNPPLTFDYTDGVYHVRVKHVEAQAVSPTPDNGTGTSSATGTGSTGVSTGDKRYRTIPIDHYDVVEIAHLIQTMNNKTTDIVPAGMGQGGGTGTGAGATGAGSMGGSSMGGGSMGGGMGMGR